MVLFACYHLCGSRLKPCFDHKLEFLAVFQLALPWKSLKKSYWFKLAPAFWNFHLKCRPHLKTPPLKQMFSLSSFTCSILWMFFLYLIILQYVFFPQIQTPQRFSSAALLFYTEPKLQKRVIYSAYLHQLSCHKILLKNFHFSQGRSSTPRLL